MIWVAVRVMIPNMRWAHTFVLSVDRLTQSFPKQEPFGLTSQFRRAAVSIPANIAEGFVKKSIKDKCRYFNIAQGSLEECRYFLILSKDLNYGEVASLKSEVEVSKILDTYMRSMLGCYAALVPPGLPMVAVYTSFRLWLLEFLTPWMKNQCWLWYIKNQTKMRVLQLPL